MVEVDLRLFVTCRLCLDVQGHFQIDPTVQQQIKYCFDIDVEPFDGLPQLICKTCENILREHYAVKKNFTDKQTELKTKLQDNARKIKKSPSTQQNNSENCTTNKKNVNSVPLSRLDDSDTSNSNSDCLEKTAKRKKKVKKKKKINRLSSASSCDDLEPNSSKTQIETTKPLNNEEFILRDENLNKYFVCRICTQQFQNNEEITKHAKEHSTLYMKYNSVFKTSCLVVMKKSDKKLNMYSSNSVVVYSSDSIIQNKYNPFYYIHYQSKTYNDIPISKNNTNSESIDIELIPRKRRRLLSRSSSETIVINRNSENEDTSHINEDDKNPPTVIDCIDLSDSSDDDCYESNEASNSLRSKRKLEYKPMHNIIKMCYNKYIKQLDSLEKKTSQSDKGKEDFLQHKVLSIGRKIINNNGFNCIGLLRFLEYKDLSVIWKETSVLNCSNIGKYVRIATRVRENETNNTNNGVWTNYNMFKFENDYSYISTNVVKRLKTFSNFKKKSIVNSVTNKEANTNIVVKLTHNDSNVNSVTNQEPNESSAEILPLISSVFSHTDLEITKTDADPLLLQKLLNKNPVSNPKQLPKKGNSNENYSKNMKVFSAPNTVPFVNPKQVEKNNEVDTNKMPIVTSTVSLAKLFDKEKNVPAGDSVNTLNNKKIYPRIKVKPVSELMPEKVTNNVNSKNTPTNGTPNTPQIIGVIWPNQNVTLNKQQTRPTQPNSIITINSSQIWHPSKNSISQQPVWPNQNISLSEQPNTVPVNVSQCSLTSDSAKDYIILDTVEFPNTKTASPFQYLKNLLLLHNITLLDANQALPTGFTSLIKLKLVYQQEKCEAITLSLSLDCFNNLFSIQIKDLNQSDVNINNLSAHWQWQLLKIYTNDVTTKVLQTASKVSQETFAYTTQFFALLRSIKSINDVT